ncbi:hypothetical protein ABBQ32_010963 [Trebouxia sp. C0010 RCD-2024]
MQIASQLENLLLAFDESLYAVSLEVLSASSASTAEDVKLSQAAEWLSLGPHLRGEGLGCTLWLPTGQHSSDELEEEVIASHGGSWTAADVTTRCTGTASGGVEGWKDNPISSRLSDTSSSSADEQLLDLASDSFCLNQGMTTTSAMPCMLCHASAAVGGWRQFCGMVLKGPDRVLPAKWCIRVKLNIFWYWFTHMCCFLLLQGHQQPRRK